jgi:hypothetical protein
VYNQWPVIKEVVEFENQFENLFVIFKTMLFSVEAIFGLGRKLYFSRNVLNFYT